MIDPQITRRFESEAAFQEEKLRNLFRVVFRDEVKAWDRWQEMTERQGFKQAQSILKDHPARLGKLQGKARFGFLKDRAFDERETALKEVGYQAERWNSAQMQLAQHNARIQEEKQLARTDQKTGHERPAPQHDLGPQR